MNRYRLLFLLLWLCGIVVSAQAQDSVKASVPARVYDMPGADKGYIGKFNKPSNIRLILGTQGTGVEYGSLRAGSSAIGNDLYGNSGNYVGAGLSYKLIDGDLYYTLPRTREQQQGMQNLKQFKLAFSYAAQRFTIRAFFNAMYGAIVSGGGGHYQSNPNISMTRMGLQGDYVFNYRRYSYRAANALSAFQRRNAGSFILRAELFYRELGADSGLVPADREKRKLFLAQTNLRYLRAPVLYVIPGYGWNLTAFKGKLLISPLIFMGPGYAYNVYKTKTGRYTHPNWEWSTQVSVSAGYNGARVYSSLTFSMEAGYIPLEPSYLSSTSLRAYVTTGYRFGYIEKFIPRSFL